MLRATRTYAGLENWCGTISIIAPTSPLMTPARTRRSLSPATSARVPSLEDGRLGDSGAGVVVEGMGPGGSRGPILPDLGVQHTAARRRPAPDPRSDGPLRRDWG